MNSHTVPAAAPADPVTTVAAPPSGQRATGPARRRRRRRSAERWRELVTQQPNSGMDVAAFCEHHDVGVAGFAAWRGRLRRGGDAIPAAGAAALDPVFLRVHSEPEAATPPLTATFPGGFTLHVDPEHLGPLVAALAAASAEATPC